MTTRSLSCGALVALVVLAAPAGADAVEPGAAEAHAARPESDPCVGDAIDAIQRRYESIDRLRADFVQTTRTAALSGSASRVSGTVTFAKPGKMHWAYRDPDSSMISDGRTLWIFDPAFNEAQKLPVGDEYLAGASIQFLLGQGDMRRDFDVVGIACSDDGVELELSPVSPASYEKIRVRVDPASGDLLRTTVFDLVGNVTEVAFSNLETSFELDPDLFAFRPPEGVRVIELSPDAR